MRLSLTDLVPFAAGASPARLRFKAAIRSITGGGVETSLGLMATPFILASISSAAGTEGLGYTYTVGKGGKIIAELEQGRVPWVQPWFGSGAGVSALLGLPRNATTGRAYGGINILILWSAVAERGFTSQNWLTFRQALKLNAHVRKGEKGTTVVYADRFVPYRERTRAAEAGDEPEAIPFLKRFTGRIALPVILTRPARSTAPTGVPRPRYQYQ